MLFRSPPTNQKNVHELITHPIILSSLSPSPAGQAARESEVKSERRTMTSSTGRPLSERPRRGPGSRSGEVWLSSQMPDTSRVSVSHWESWDLFFLVIPFPCFSVSVSHGDDRNMHPACVCLWQSRFFSPPLSIPLPHSFSL